VIPVPGSHGYLGHHTSHWSYFHTFSPPDCPLMTPFHSFSGFQFSFCLQNVGGLHSAGLDNNFSGFARVSGLCSGSSSLALSPGDEVESISLFFYSACTFASPFLDNPHSFQRFDLRPCVPFPHLHMICPLYDSSFPLEPHGTSFFFLLRVVAFSTSIARRPVTCAGAPIYGLPFPPVLS